MITLYGKAASRTSRNLWALEELGIAYKHVPFDYLKGDTKMAEYLTINPAGKMPSIVDGDVVMAESLAINAFIAQKYGKGKLWPADEKGQAKCLQWTLWAAAELEPVAYGRLREVLFKKEDERDHKLLAELAERGKPIVGVLDAVLQDTPFICGSQFTLADLNVACVMEYMVRSNFDISPWPKTAAWYKACAGRLGNMKVQEMRAQAMKVAA